MNAMLDECSKLERGESVFAGITEEVCSTVHEKFLDVKIAEIVLSNMVETLGFTYTGGDELTIQGFLMVGSSVVVNIVNFVMILPFAVSSIIEIRHSLKTETKETQATKLGVKVMLAGFITLIVGVFIIAFFMFCAVLPQSNCFG